jgi:hypothetical protein
MYQKRHYYPLHIHKQKVISYLYRIDVDLNGNGPASLLTEWPNSVISLHQGVNNLVIQQPIDGDGDENILLSQTAIDTFWINSIEIYLLNENRLVATLAELRDSITEVATAIAQQTVSDSLSGFLHRKLE